VGNEKWVMAEKAYDNIFNQKKDISIESGINARNLIGKKVKNPLTGAEHIILPASFVDPEYGTGVVYSVPGHAPADLIALIDLKKDEKELEKYDIKDEVQSIQAIGMIKLEGYGRYLQRI
jgi:leucyl-tRNA synthetase